MYRRKTCSQLDLFTQEAPIMDVLDEDDEIIKLAHAIDWDYVDEIYSRYFEGTSSRGNPNAISSRVAFGALFVKQYLGLSDRETYQEIKRSPYWQYFLGMDTFSSKLPFQPSYMTAFRKRFPEDVMELVNNYHAKQVRSKKKSDSDDNDGNPSSGSSQSSDSSASGGEEPEPEGVVIIDATCCEADIAFPTDINLLNKSRLWLERIVDHLYREFGSLKKNGTKPRTYRKEARNKYHKFVKHPRQRKTKTMRAAVGEQLNYIKRDLGYIDQYFGLSEEAEQILLPVEARRLEAVRLVYEQQTEMHKNRKHVVSDRIVSLSQPWIRPIVRGKQKAKTEFGAKLSISVADGYTFVDQLTFNAYNEGEHGEFVMAIEKYRERFGHYPAKVLADTIYGNRKNRAWCKERGIYLSAEKLGRKPKNQNADRKQRAKDISERNEVECKFGNLKRRFGLDLVTSKLEETSKTEIYFSIFVMNMTRKVRTEEPGLFVWLGFGPFFPVRTTGRNQGYPDFGDSRNRFA